MAENTIFEKYLADAIKILQNSEKAFADKGLTGFQKLALYRYTLKCVRDTCAEIITDFDNSLTPWNRKEENE
jgi:hypothetical protein